VNRGESPERGVDIGASDFGISEVLMTRDRDTPWWKSRNRSGPSIHGGHVAEIESPSVFRIPGIRIDRGSVSLGVASREILINETLNRFKCE
jgi:hypothetical protein